MQLIILLICLTGILLTQTLIGGAKLVFGIPGYLVVAAAGILAIAVPTRRLSLGVRLPAIVSTLVLVFYVVIRSFDSPIEYLARPDRFMVLAALVVYLLTAHYFTNPSQRRWMLYGLLLFSILHVAGGILQFARNDNFMFLSMLPAGSPVPEIYRGADYGWRASGFYVCPNHLAGLLETLAVIAVARACFARGSALSRLVALYLGITALVGVALTGSRGGYLSTAAGIVVFVILSIWVVGQLRSRRTWLRMCVVGILAVAMIAGALIIMGQSASIQSRLDQMADTGNMRLLMWAAALEQFQLSPTFGTGSGTYLYFGRQFRSAAVQNDPQHVHNDYLELLSEYGVVGMLLFSVFLVMHLYYGIRAISAIIRNRMRPAKRMFSNELALLIGVLAAIAALAAHSVVDFNCHLPGNVLYFAFLFGILACPTADPTVIAKPAPPITKSIQFLLPGISILLAVLTAPLLVAEYHAEWARVHLRNKLHFQMIAQTQAQAGWAMQMNAAGLFLPASGTELQWHTQYLRDHLLPNAVRHAEAALKTEKENPEIYYHLGEARHFLTLVAPDDADKRAMFAFSGDAYAEGLKLFPTDARLQMRLARAFDNVGLLDRAEDLYVKALQADPNLGNLYAYYGYHLWLRRKLTRAEAYYRRALELDRFNPIAPVGLREIGRVRALAQDRAFVEEYGNPLETFDLEPPTAEDEARGVDLGDLDQ